MRVVVAVAKVAVVLGAAGALSLACEAKKATEVMIAVQTDVQIPHDLDAVTIDVQSFGGTQHHQTYPVGPSGLHLPATLAVVPQGDSSGPVDVIITGHFQTKDRVTRRARFTFAKGRVALLRMPLRFSCFAKTGCSENETCVAGQCQPVDVDVTKLPDFRDDLVTSGDGPGQTCYDPYACSEGAQPLVAGDGCTFELPEGQTEPTLLQSLPTSSQIGFCAHGGCWVPIDFDPQEGWDWVDATHRTVRIAPGICEQISAGTILGISSSSKCGTKKTETPLCSTEAPAPVDGGVDGGTTCTGSRTPASPPWTTAPTPAGAIVRTITFAGSTTYVGTENGGLYATTDGGKTFTRTSCPAHVVTSVALDAGRIYVAEGGGSDWSRPGALYVSADGAKTWSTVALEGKDVRAVVRATSALWASTWEGDVVRSTDGTTWTPMSTGLSSLHVQALYERAGFLYAGTESGVARISEASPTSWSSTTGITATRVTSLIEAGGRLYAGARGNPPMSIIGGVFSTTDGTSWVDDGNGLPPSRAINAMTTSGTRLYAGMDWGGGVFTKLATDSSWSPMSVSIPIINYNFTALATAGDGSVWAGNLGEGLYVSTPSGTVTNERTGLRAIVHDVLVSGSTLIAGTHGAAVFTSADGGGTWTQRTSGLASTNGMFGLQLLQNAGQVFLVEANHVYRSSDAGASWSDLGAPVGTYETAIFQGSTLFVGGASGLLSWDGATWTRRDAGLPGSGIHALLVDGTSIYAGTPNGLFRLSGTSWVEIKTKLPGVNALIATSTPTFGYRLFAATNDFVWGSVDGDSWTRVRPTGFTGVPTISLLTVDDGGRTRLFAGGYAGMLASTVDGDCWVMEDNGLPAFETVNRMTSSGGRILLSTDSGIYSRTP